MCYFQVSLCEHKAREQRVYTSIHHVVQVYLHTDPNTNHHKKSTVILHYKGRWTEDFFPDWIFFQLAVDRRNG